MTEPTPVAPHHAPPSTAAERAVARAAALAPGPCPLPQLARLSGRPEPEVADAVATLTARGLLTDTAGGLTAGRLLREQVDALPPSLLGHLHRRAAEVLAGADPGRAAGHLLAAVRATGQADPALVDRLVADGAVDPSAGADLLLAVLPGAGTGERSRWLLAAGDLLVLAGRGDEAVDLLAAELAADRAGATDRALLLGRLGSWQAGGRPSAALDQLDRARRLAGPEQHAWLAATAAAVAARADHPRADALLREAGRAQAAHPSARAGVRLALARAARALALGAVPTAGDVLATVDPARPALRAEAAAVRAERIAVRLALGEYPDAATAVRAAYDDLPASGTPAVLALSCLRMLAVGELPEAEAQARLALDRPPGPLTDEVRAALLSVVVEVAYRLGRPAAARTVLDRELPDHPWPDRMPWALLRCAAAADPEPLRHPELIRCAAADAARSVRPLLLVAQHGPRLVRALLLLGDGNRARAVADRLAAVAERTPVPLWQGLAGHAGALVRRDPSALRAAVRSLRATGAGPALADALLDLARSPRVRLAEARPAAQEAAARYGRLGAAGDQERAERWDRRLAATRRRPAPGPPGHGLAALTAREAGIAELLAAGATKQQVAGRLYLSFHTVDTHLRAIYAKLGIRNRVQLARLWDARPVSAPPDAFPSAAPRSSRGAG
ncbi:helix-turn-helix transcriptional regulator [Micromonospora sp. AMSO31t]|nr:helix-turn-helix transcriptional regulator [Micromonospora sp. AMSO31t]KAB1902606.1 helix-turn-helix transcriptional regulator [Micromonospora sp. AMSO31t]